MPLALTEVKDGVALAHHRLLDPITVLGRSEDADIVLAHQSCSRRHAAIYLHPLSVQDSSTHGTFVDKIKVLETADLRPGCVIQFGASTRLYFIEELLGDTTISNRPQPTGTTSHAPARPEPPQMQLPHNDNAPADETPSIDAFFSDESKVPRQYAKVWERYKANKCKLEHIQEESDRIRAKGELSDGQSRQLERNQEKEEHLRQVLEEAENHLLVNIFLAKPSSTVDRESYALEDEEVDDRTAQVSCRSKVDADTEASLTTKFKSLIIQLEKLQETTVLTERNRDQVRERVRRLTDAGDSEEAFFAQNDLDLLSERLEKLISEKHSVSASVTETVRLLKLANPKLLVDPVTGFVGTSALIPKTQANSSKTQANSSLMRAEFNESMPPPAIKMDEDDRMLPPPPKQTRPDRPTSVPRVVSSMDGQNDLKRKGTLAGLVDSSGLSGKQSTLQYPNVDTWKAPTNQDGSGTTKLNQKFAGRY